MRRNTCTVPFGALDRGIFCLFAASMYLLLLRGDGYCEGVTDGLNIVRNVSIQLEAGDR